jgi:hypothetical protein
VTCFREGYGKPVAVVPTLDQSLERSESHLDSRPVKARLSLSAYRNSTMNPVVATDVRLDSSNKRHHGHGHGYIVSTPNLSAKRTRLPCYTSYSCAPPFLPFPSLPFEATCLPKLSQ